MNHLGVEMKIEVAINKRGDAKIAVLHQGAGANTCALGMIEEMREFEIAGNFDLDLARMIASTVDKYIVYDARKGGKIYRMMLRKFGAEVSRHYHLREHVIYDVPDDLFDVVDVFGVNIEPELRKRIYKMINEASSWEEFKDRLLAMKAAEVL